MNRWITEQIPSGKIYLDNYTFCVVNDVFMLSSEDYINIFDGSFEKGGFFSLVKKIKLGDKFIFTYDNIIFTNINVYPDFGNKIIFNYSNYLL